MWADYVNAVAHLMRSPSQMAFAVRIELKSSLKGNVAIELKLFKFHCDFMIRAIEIKSERTRTIIKGNSLKNPTEQVLKLSLNTF